MRHRRLQAERYDEMPNETKSMLIVVGWNHRVDQQVADKSSVSKQMPRSIEQQSQ